MFKETIITFLNFLTPFTNLFQNKKNKFSQLSLRNFYFIKKNNLHQIDNFCDANVDRCTQIRNCWEEDLPSQKNIVHLQINFFNTLFLIPYKK